MARKQCGYCGVRLPKKEMVRDDDLRWLCQDCKEQLDSDSSSSEETSTSESPSSASSTVRPGPLPKPVLPLPRAKIEFKIPVLNPPRKMDLTDE